MLQFLRKACSWALTSSAARRARRELVGRREEEALERRAVRSPGINRLRPDSCEVGRLVQARLAAALVRRDLRDALDTRRHLEAGEPSGKMTRNGFGGACHGRRARRMPAVPDARDREADPDQPGQRTPSATNRRRMTTDVGRRAARGGAAAARLLRASARPREVARQQVRRGSGIRRQVTVSGSCSARSVVKRSSKPSTGTSSGLSQPVDEALGLARLLADLTSERQRHADDDALGALARDQLDEAFESGLGARTLDHADWSSKRAGRVRRQRRLFSPSRSRRATIFTRARLAAPLRPVPAPRRAWRDPCRRRGPLSPGRRRRRRLRPPRP